MGKKILLIDDEADIIKAFSARLVGKGYGVVSATDGMKGIALAKTEKPDIIILDILMPGIDGFEVFKRMKKDPDLSDIPVIVVTAKGNLRDTFEAFGVDAFVPKPFDIESVIQKVETFLRKRALIVSDDQRLVETITLTLKKKDYEVDVVAGEDEMARKGMATRYHTVVAHLPCVKKQPKDFIAQVRGMKNRMVRIITYSDSRVKGTEHNDQVHIGELKTTWERAGAHVFYDARITSGLFGDFVI